MPWVERKWQKIGKIVVRDSPFRGRFRCITCACLGHLEPRSSMRSRVHPDLIRNIAIARQAQTKRPSPRRFCWAKLREALLQPEEGRLQESITLRNDDGAGYRESEIGAAGGAIGCSGHSRCSIFYWLRNHKVLAGQSSNTLINRNIRYLRSKFASRPSERTTNQQLPRAAFPITQTIGIDNGVIYGRPRSQTKARDRTDWCNKWCIDRSARDSLLT